MSRRMDDIDDADEVPTPSDPGDGHGEDCALVQLVGTLQKRRAGLTTRNNQYVLGSFCVRQSSTVAHYIPFCTFEPAVIETLESIEPGERVRAWGRLEQYRYVRDGRNTSFLQVKVDGLEPAPS